MIVGFKSSRVAALSAWLVILACASARADAIYLTELDLSKISQGYGKPQIDKNIVGKPMSIGGQKFEHGLGTHAISIFYIGLNGAAQRFTAAVGVDDSAGKLGSVVFKVVGDGKMLFKSPAMHGGDAPQKVDVDLKGIATLILIANDAADGIDHDHADWADAKIEYTGAKPQSSARPAEEAVILTPKPSPNPKINGPKVFGVRPGSPFLFRIPATGQRPMQFAAENLPGGLQLDSSTGIISGSLKDRGEFRVTLRAKNALGSAERTFKVVCGDKLALTPTPMGWNSWYCFLDGVTEDQIRAAADAMIASGMADHGYSYINIDDGWEIKPGSDDPKLKGEARDANGRININKKFRDMKALADYIHSKGLKFGIYSSPGPRTCAGFEGTYQHDEIEAKTYAEWGVDLLKYDWCSYGRIDNGKTLEGLQKPYRLMNSFLVKQNRDIIFSLCQYGMGKVSEWGADVGGHCWRTTGDLGVASSLAANMFAIGFGQNGLEKWAGPGHWNDPDFIMIGYIHWGNKLRPTPMTPNEQYTHVTLWSLLAAPLVFSGDMTKLDDFTTSLLTNDEVLEVNLDPLGQQARRLAKDEDLEVWGRDLEDGTKAIGVFNRGEYEAPVVAKWSDLGIEGRHIVRDCWRQKDVGTFEGEFRFPVGAHGAAMFRLRKVQ